MDIEEFRRAGYQAIDRICEYYYTLKDQPVVSKVQPGYLRHLIPSSIPEKGQNFQLIADDFQKLIIPGLTHWQHPSFFGYFPTACTFEGIIADLYSTSACNPGFNWNSSPACTELEAIVMDWAAQLLGLSSVFTNASGVGGGSIQTTASDAALVAVVAARSLYLTNHPATKLENLVIYTTTQTHSLGLKAGLVLGLSVRVLEVKAKDEFALRGETLKRALDEDERAGKSPFILIATVGTTSSGAIDNLAEIQQAVSAKSHPLWLHVDAAWAGVALSCPEHRETCYLKEINDFAHSFCTNFHKWGLVNFDASALWVRDRKYLTNALDVTPPFLRTTHGDAGTVIDYRNWHLALGRRFRSLKMWFVFRSFGAEGFRDYIRQTIKLNRQFADLVESSDNLVLVTPPSLALTVFRLEPKPVHNHAAATTDSLNRLNKLFYARICTRDDLYLTQTELNGIVCIRLAVGAARTTGDHIKKAYHLLQQEADLVIKVWKEADIY